ncbi:hypothetical protein [Bradyrhizobium sp. Tv2a-2]|uniref:hypothetical protein n=1 Tax=Bradyrhizobium sp. Tv2a-2 TaxID=113395 RepID=UPI001FD882A1|nr:hypothetical protein [Bradyrhizobium sp. Tv2a-2]
MNFQTVQSDSGIGCEMNNHIWHATLVAFTVMPPISTIGHARAHDYQHPQWNSWYDSLHSGKGPCCDGSDAKRVDDADRETEDSHYRVRVDGEWVDVPNDAVADGPNRAGRTMVWPLLPGWSPKGALLHAGDHRLIASAGDQQFPPTPTRNDAVYCFA